MLKETNIEYCTDAHCGLCSHLTDVKSETGWCRIHRVYKALTSMCNKFRKRRTNG